ncbi:MAG: hypothetical protein QXZ20_03445, partial [Candidatus Aenigmatarchaeota archaeon]
NESISMISEVLSLKKPCVCVILEKHLDKHRIFLDSIRDDITFLSSPYRIEGLYFRVSNILEHNKRVVKEAIKKFL